MSDDKTPFCMNCGNAMTATRRIGLEPESVYRCEPCKIETWVTDEKNDPKKAN